MSPLPRRFLFLVLGCLLAAGCGDGADKTAPFVGTWTVASGSTMVACPPPLPTLTIPFDRAEQMMVKGTDSDLVMTPLPGCMLKLDVADKVATMRPDQSCNIIIMGLAVAAKITTGTFTVTDTGATFSYTGTGTLGTSTCTFTAAGTSTKGAAGDAGAASDAGAAGDAGAPG